MPTTAEVETTVVSTENTQTTFGEQFNVLVKPQRNITDTSSPQIVGCCRPAAVQSVLKRVKCKPL